MNRLFTGVVGSEGMLTEGVGAEVDPVGVTELVFDLQAPVVLDLVATDGLVGVLVVEVCYGGQVGRREPVRDHGARLDFMPCIVLCPQDEGD